MDIYHVRETLEARAWLDRLVEWRDLARDPRPADKPHFRLEGGSLVATAETIVSLVTKEIPE